MFAYCEHLYLSDAQHEHVVKSVSLLNTELFLVYWIGMPTFALKISYLQPILLAIS